MRNNILKYTTQYDNFMLMVQKWLKKRLKNGKVKINTKININ